MASTQPARVCVSARRPGSSHAAEPGTIRSAPPEVDVEPDDGLGRWASVLSVLEGEQLRIGVVAGTRRGR
jgi:hypothetical protein